jgi:hypothetical protein
LEGEDLKKKLLGRKEDFKNGSLCYSQTTCLLSRLRGSEGARENGGNIKKTAAFITAKRLATGQMERI